VPPLYREECSISLRLPKMIAPKIDDLHETPRLGTVLLAFTTLFFEA
jgi:hypothetical protein